MGENDSSLVPMGGYPGAPVTEGCSVLVPNRLYKAYIFDLDGTIYLGDELLPGAKRLINALRERGKDISDEALGELVSSVGPNARQLNNEVEKLALSMPEVLVTSRNFPPPSLWNSRSPSIAVMKTSSLPSLS